MKNENTQLRIEKKTPKRQAKDENKMHKKGAHNTQHSAQQYIMALHLHIIIIYSQFALLGFFRRYATHFGEPLFKPPQQKQWKTGAIW